VEEQEDGSYINKNFTRGKNDEHPVFKNKDRHNNWVNKNMAAIADKDRFVMSPQEYYLTRGIHMERPFTGEFWDTKDAGHYECKSCSQKLFMSDHKYLSKTGYATFWSHILHTIGYKEDHLDRAFVNSTNSVIEQKILDQDPEKRVVCSNCNSHLGFMFTDGPAPFYKRFNINSGAVNFVLKPFFPVPESMKAKEQRRVFEAKQEADRWAT